MKFEAFVAHSGMDLPEALKKAERYSWNLWDNHGSACICVGIVSSWEFIEVLETFLATPFEERVSQEQNRRERCCCVVCS